jgi:hypothetical protein
VPDLPVRVLLRAFRQRNESGRIHYIAAYADGGERRLYVDEGNALYPVLESHLLAQGYTGPANGAEDEE